MYLSEAGGYIEYRDKPKLQPPVGEISWSKNLIVMSRCKDDLEREFYIRMTRKYGWSKNVLIHHVENESPPKACKVRPDPVFLGIWTQFF